MVTVFGGKRISTIGTASTDSATACSISEVLPGLIEDLPARDIECLHGFLDVCQGGIVLKDFASREASIEYLGRGVIRFNHLLVQSLREKHGDEAKSKLRDIVKPLLMSMVKDAKEHLQHSEARVKSFQKQCEEAKAERERIGLLQLQSDPMHLIAELTKRVEQLEARR